MAIPVFTWGSGGQALTPEDARRKRAVAESLLASSQAPARNWAEGLSRMAGAYTGTVLQDRAAEAEQAGLAEATALLQGLDSQSSEKQIAALLAHQWASDDQRSVASALLGNKLQQSDPLYRLKMAQAQLDYDQDLAGKDSAATGFAPVPGTIGGKPAYIQFDNAGGMTQMSLPEGFEPQSRFNEVDLGDRVVVTDTTTGQQTVYPKSGNVPEGYAPNGAGGIDPMTGSPQDLEKQRAVFQMEQRAMAADQRADIVIDAIAKATDQSSWATTGMLGTAGRALGFTPHRDLEGTINTIKANIGFNELQMMREMSPTGGALGQVAIQELEMLQSTIASLNPNQSEQQLDENLKTIGALLDRQKQYRRMAIEQQMDIYGAPASAAGDGEGWQPVEGFDGVEIRAK